MVKLRDAAAMMAEAANQYIDSLAPVFVEAKYDVAKIRWEQADGTKGKYERSDDVDNADFKALLADLEQHKGRMTKDSYFYWLFDEMQVVGRKKKA